VKKDLVDKLRKLYEAADELQVELEEWAQTGAENAVRESVADFLEVVDKERRSSKWW